MKLTISLLQHKLKNYRIFLDYNLGVNKIISFVAFSTADFVKGKTGVLPVFQLSSWSLQCGDFGSPLSPVVMPCRVASQSPGTAIRRIETAPPTFGEAAEPVAPLSGNVGTVNCAPISGAIASGCEKRTLFASPHAHLVWSAPNFLLRLASASVSEARSRAM